MFTNNKVLIDNNRRYFCDYKDLQNLSTRRYFITIKDIDEADKIANASSFYLKNHTMFVDIVGKQYNMEIHIREIYNCEKNLCFSFNLIKDTYYFYEFDKLLSNNNWIVIFQKRKLGVDKHLSVPDNVDLSYVYEFEILELKYVVR